MSGAGGLDIRLPIGGLFTLLGLMLAGYGVATTDTARIRALDLGEHQSLVGARDARLRRALLLLERPAGVGPRHRPAPRGETARAARPRSASGSSGGSAEAGRYSRREHWTSRALPSCSITRSSAPTLRGRRWASSPTPRSGWAPPPSRFSPTTSGSPPNRCEAPVSWWAPWLVSRTATRRLR